MATDTHLSSPSKLAYQLIFDQSGKITRCHVSSEHASYATQALVAPSESDEPVKDVQDLDELYQSLDIIFNMSIKTVSFAATPACFRSVYFKKLRKLAAKGCELGISFILKIPTTSIPHNALLSVKRQVKNSNIVVQECQGESADNTERASRPSSLSWLYGYTSL